MTTKFLGAWFKGPLGLQAKIHEHGQAVNEAVICRDDLVKDLLSYLYEHYATTMTDWMTERHYVQTQGGIRLKWADARYRLPSKTRKGVFYEVVQQGDRWTCECEGFGYRHTCSHIDDAQGPDGELYRIKEGT